MRDLNGYMGPSLTSGEGMIWKTHWSPSRIEVHEQAHKGSCKCPCTIAHPYQLKGSCKGQIVADAITPAPGGFYPIPLCGACATAQLAKMNKGSQPPEPQSPADTRAAIIGGIATVLLVATVTWYFSDWGAALAILVGAFVGVTVRETWH